MSLAIKEDTVVSSGTSKGNWTEMALALIEHEIIKVKHVHLYCLGTSWESMSTKQKHLAPGGLALTRRTFLSSRYAKGSKAFRIVSTVVVGFTFFIIMAVK